MNQIGIGLRECHIDEVLSCRPELPLLEVLADNYIDLPENHELWINLRKIADLYPLDLHCVGMNIASIDELNYTYLAKIKKMANLLKPQSISDHLCWSAVENVRHHDLLPFPFNEETLTHTSKRIRKIQEELESSILVENVSTYIEFKNSEMSEAEFLNEVCLHSGCELLLDINNLYVNSFNHHFCPQIFMNAIPSKLVKRYHLAGFEADNDLLIDTHGANVSDQVWVLFDYALKSIGRRPAIIERDNNIPEFSGLMREVRVAERVAHESG